MTKPPPFDPKKKIGIVALAGPMDGQMLLEGEAQLKKLGYEVLIAPSCFEAHRYLAGVSDEARALDLKMLFTDDDIGAILNMRGGYGSNRILPYLQGFNFANYPKPFIGYSDMTYMHLYLNQCDQLITYHGPMIKDLLEDDELTTENWIKTALEGIPLTLKSVTFMNKGSGQVSGRTVGGNLTLICSTLGTMTEIETAGKILFMEEINEAPYSVDRLLMQLLYAGKLHECAGIILGDFGHQDQEAVMETLKDILLPTGKMIAYGVPAGHVLPNLTIPLGARCVLDPLGQRITFLE
ncbi:MAG: LD-carboxypeptidase [Defluviitaleaceae bacterium]|nr:LD-carboxypeptidase [Defluviitaleaceae bacterium]